MKKLSVCVALTTMLAVCVALASSQRWPFTAPVVETTNSVIDPKQGNIIFDWSSGSEGDFKGYNGTSWITFGGSGGAALAVATVNSNDTLTASNDIVLADTSSTNITLTLPSASGNEGKVFIIKKIAAANRLTIDGNSTETIDGQASIDIVSGDATVEVYSDGSNFRIKSVNDKWRVDANISGSNPSLGTSAVSSYTGIEEGSLTLTNNSSNGNLEAQIPCSSTNAPSGATCSTGNESVGISFVPPRSGPVEVCASFSHHINVGNIVAAEVLTTFQVVRTPNNAQTISEEGKERISSRHQGANGNGNGATIAHKNCGVFNLTGGTQYTFRLFYEQTASNATGSVVLGDASSSHGQRDIHWDAMSL